MRFVTATTPPDTFLLEHFLLFLHSTPLFQQSFESFKNDDGIGCTQRKRRTRLKEMKIFLTFWANLLNFLCHWNQNFSGYKNKLKRNFLINFRIWFLYAWFITEFFVYTIDTCKSSISCIFISHMDADKDSISNWEKSISYVASYISHQFSRCAFKDDLVQ